MSKKYGIKQKYKQCHLGILDSNQQLTYGTK
jgi:hypothetical protein